VSRAVAYVAHERLALHSEIPGNVAPNSSDGAAAPAAQMYFTAGPNHGSGALFGYLTAVSTDLTEGNAE
jgi:hypothetical protein